MINRKAFLLNAIDEGFKNDVSGYPLVLKHSKGRKLIDYKIYGNSVQNGTPTPDSPVEIESVGDRTVNLIDYHNLSSTTNKGITYTNNNDGSFTANGTLIDTLSTYSFEVPSLEKGVTYYTSCGQDLSEKNRRYYLFLIIKNTSTNKIRYHSSNAVNKTFILAENEEVTVLEIRINDSTASSITVDNVIFKPIICKNEEYKEYEPYGYKIPVKVSGTNIFDGLLQEGDYGAGANKISSVNYIPVKPNTTYRFSRNNERVYMYDEAKTQLSRVDTGNNGNTITTTEDTRYIRVVWFGTEDTTQTIWINEGTELLDYEPYYEPIITNIYLDEPLRKIGDYADYIDFENQKVVINIEEIDSTGTLPLEESLQVLATPTEETIELPNIPTHKGTNIIKVDTIVEASNLNVSYKSFEKE